MPLVDPRPTQGYESLLRFSRQEENLVNTAEVAYVGSRCKLFYELLEMFC